MSRKQPKNTDGRKPDGRFSEGNPGKPKGAKNKTSRVAMDLIEARSDEIIGAVIQRALEGDMAAGRLCVERIAPAPKDAPVQFDLPQMKTSADAAKAAGSVLDAVSSGDITPQTGAAVMNLVDAFRRTLETTELEQRLTELEQSIDS